MKAIANYLYSLATGRSTKWSALRKSHLEAHPECAACGRRKGLEVHHVRPFHLFPERELDPDNLVTLCAKPCHIVFGHCGDWGMWNKGVRLDALVHLANCVEARAEAVRATQARQTPIG